ncbi:ECF transporter S component [Ileibacterium valens]|uniref:ECF transporter S component n=1 Tax=Ileibacterium valens TaxID=1862668 RepID=UPI00321FEC5C
MKKEIGRLLIEIQQEADCCQILFPAVPAGHAGRHRIRKKRKLGDKMKTNSKTRKMSLFAMFLAIELMLVLTPIGYIRLPGLSITMMHIPVIAAGILLGWKYGAALGLVFGLTSIWNATMQPGPTSFVFSPFVTIAGISGNWTSLIIALVPRILLGAIAGWLFEAFVIKAKMNTPLAACLAAVLATFCHTFMVLGLIYLLWGGQYASAIGSAPEALLGLLAMVVVTNGLAEMALAGVVCMALVKAIKPSVIAKMSVSKA